MRSAWAVRVSTRTTELFVSTAARRGMRRPSSVSNWPLYHQLLSCDQPSPAPLTPVSVHILSPSLVTEVTSQLVPCSRTMPVSTPPAGARKRKRLRMIRASTSQSWSMRKSNPLMTAPSCSTASPTDFHSNQGYVRSRFMVSRSGPKVSAPGPLLPQYPACPGATGDGLSAKVWISSRAMVVCSRGVVPVLYPRLTMFRR